MNHLLLPEMVNNHESHRELRAGSGGEGIWILLLATLFLSLAIFI
ncbi:MAG: hypothetical protein V4568_16765 [Pseudomonadota bacterium]